MAIVTRREFWDRLELALYGKTGNTFGAATALGIDALYDDLVAQPAPATVTRERELLRELVALVRGECPSLLNEDSGGDVRLSMAIDDALAAPPAEDADRAPSLGTVTFDHKAGTVSYAPRHAAQAPPASDPPGLVALVDRHIAGLRAAYGREGIDIAMREMGKIRIEALEGFRDTLRPASPQAETKGDA